MLNWLLENVASFGNAVGPYSNIIGLISGCTLCASLQAWWFRRKETAYNADMRGLKERIISLKASVAARERERDDALMERNKLPEIALQNFEKEERQKNFERAADSLQQWFESVRIPASRAVHLLAEFYSSMAHQHLKAMKEAVRLHQLASLLDPENEVFLQLAIEASEMESSATEPQLKGVQQFDPVFEYAKGLNPNEIRGLANELCNRIEDLINAGHWRSTKSIAFRARKIVSRQLAKESPTRLSVELSVARAHHFNAEDNEALAILRNLQFEIENGVEAPPEFILSVNRNLVAVLSNFGMYDELKRVVEQVLAEDPQASFARLKLAQIYKAEGNDSDAHRILEIDNRVTDPNEFQGSARLYHILEKIMAKYGKKPLENDAIVEKIEDIKKLLEMKLCDRYHPDSIRAVMLLANCLMVLGSYQEAYQELSPCVEKLNGSIGPRHHITLTAKVSMATALLHMGRFDEAKHAANEILSLPGPLPNNSDSLSFVDEAQLVFSAASAAMLQKETPEA